MTDQEVAEKYAERETEFCRCAGFTCSGCELKTKKFAMADFFAGLAHRDSQVQGLMSALRFYADSANWFGPQYFNDERYFLKIAEKDGSPSETIQGLIGGKIAREALSRFEQGK